MRSRDLRPGFFKNEQLARCEPLARILFQGLWALADRGGRLEDRPERIRVEVLPFDTVDPDALLAQLHAQALIERYVDSQGRGLIELPTFHKYQRPYKGEPDSPLPAADEPQCQRRPHSEVLRSSPEFAQSTSPFPCPLSPVPFPLSNPPGGGKTQPQNSPQRQQLGLPGVPPPLASVECASTRKTTPDSGAPLPCPTTTLLALWVEVCPALPAPVLPWSGQPARNLSARWRENAAHWRWGDQAQGLAWFRDLFAHVTRSRFLTGRVGPRPMSSTAFEASLEWLVKPDHWRKVLQGQYHDAGAR